MKGWVVVRTLLIGCTGGAVAAWFNLPVAWMLGSLAAAIVASLCSVQMFIPRPFHKLSRGVVGILVGSSITAETLSRAHLWPATIELLLIGMLLICVTSALYYRYVAGFDRLTAVSAALPGALATIPMLAIQLGANSRQVVLPHLFRITLVILLVPPLFSFWQGVDLTGSAGSNDSVDWQGTQLWVLLAGIPVWYIGSRIRLPIPEFIGPMLASAILSALGYSIELPIWLFAITFIILGSSIGAQFYGMSMRMLVGTGGHALMGTLLTFLVTLLSGFSIYWITDVPLPVAILATVPGGIAEMAILAAAMGIDPVFVTAHQIVRSVLLNASAPFLLQWFRKK